MSILQRMGRVISSNFNALLDQAEDPKKSLAQTLREMQTQLGMAKSELVRAVAAERQLKHRLEQLEQDERLWERRAALAVEQGDDALAKQALQQKRRVTDERARTEQLRAEQRGNALEMKSTWESMRDKFRDFSARQSTIATNVARARSDAGPVEGLGGSGEVFQEFRNIEERIDAVDDVLDAQREVDRMLGSSGGPGGMTRDEVEQRFRELEGAALELPSQASAPTEPELAPREQKLRVRIP